MAEHSVNLNQHSTTLNEHSYDITSIKRSLAVIEQAVTEKIPALFDALTMHLNRHDEFEKTLKEIQNDSFDHSNRISSLEMITSKHSQELLKLNA